MHILTEASWDREGMKRLLYRFGAVLTVICLVYFLRYLSGHWQAIANRTWDAHAWLMLAVAEGLYLATSLLTAMVWWIFLRGVGERIAYFPLMRIYLLAQFAKYLPGNVGHYIGRVVLARQAGIHVPRTVFSIAIETVWLVTVAGVLSLLCITTVGDQWMLQFVGKMPSAEKMAAIGMVIPLIGVILYWFVRRWNQWKEEEMASGKAIHVPGVSDYLKTLLLISGNFLIMGSILCMLGVQLFGLHALDYPMFIAAFTISWTVGFVTPGAPAGLGIREVLLVGMLASLGGSNAAALAAILRVITTLGDGLLFVMGLLLRRRVV